MDLRGLADDVHALTCEGGLVDRLVGLLPEPDGDPGAGSYQRRRGHSAAPWNSEAAAVLFSIHAGARALEADLLFRCGFPLRERGGSHGNTKAALDALPALCEAVEEHVARAAGRMVATWVSMARRLHDVDEAGRRWVPVPRARDTRPPACPYCGGFTLMMERSLRQVQCMRPGCRDSEGGQPRAHMEFGARTGDGQLVFGDGTTVNYREAWACSDHEPEPRPPWP